MKLPTVLALVALISNSILAVEVPDFVRDVTPVLNKYCVGCHSRDDAEAELALDSYAGLIKGGKGGTPIDTTQLGNSLLLARITAAKEPVMPPEDEPQPTRAEIETLIRWIKLGAPGSIQDTDPLELSTPQLVPSDTAKPITAVAYAADGSIAVARFGTVELLKNISNEKLQVFTTPGKVNGLCFSNDGQLLVAATGIAGLRGEAILWDTTTGATLKVFSGHRDTIYAAELSSDGKLLATASYDRKIILWSLESGEQVHIFTGHNGAVYDLDFSPDGQVLASASADTTVKIWNVTSGERMDTLSQPLKEQYTVDISPDGKFVIAGGEDNRIRMWRLISIDKPRINPLVYARFAHEGAVAQVQFSPNQELVVSTAADNMVKVWSADELKQLDCLDTQSVSTQSLAISYDSGQVTVGRMNGTLETYRIGIGAYKSAHVAVPVVVSQRPLPAGPPTRRPINQVAELEPNDRPSEARIVQIPAKISGRIFDDIGAVDEDLFGFQARAGETWVVEAKAAGDRSPLDSYISILHEDGTQVHRVQLQAVRDSYFTRRGKDSKGIGDFRLHNWEEMKVNQYLYASGEVVKLYQFPRGPDSGFNVYPNFGSRRGFFDTTPLAHALHEPCYIVKPHSPTAELVPNGLPIFMINYENDDDSQRRLGTNSRLTFITPQDGTYYVLVRDVRGFQGKEFKYELTVHAAEPNFRGKVLNPNPKVAPGTGQKFGVEVERIDGYKGAIDVQVTGLPAGFSVAGPLQIEDEHDRVWATLIAGKDVQTPSPEAAKKVTITVSALIDGVRIEKRIGSLGTIEVTESPKLVVDLVPDHATTVKTANLPVIEIKPGSTTTATIKIKRNGHDGRVGFGSEDSAVNAPHGVYVDNTGLNGVLIVEGQNERQLFISAEPWVKPMERLIFVEAKEAGRPTSKPVILRVLPGEKPKRTDQASR